MHDQRENLDTVPSHQWSAVKNEPFQRHKLRNWRDGGCTRSVRSLVHAVGRNTSRSQARHRRRNASIPRQSFGGMKLNFSITAWNSNAALGGLKLPNWIVVLVAGGIALLMWLTARGVWKAPSALPIALTAYGLAHTGFQLVVLAVSKDASAGVGVFLTVLGFVGLLVVVLRQIAALRTTTA